MGYKKSRPDKLARGKRTGAGYGKNMSGQTCNWKLMETACVEAAVNCSVSSGREVQAMVQKVPDSGVTHRDVSVTIFHFIYDPFRKMRGRDSTEIIRLF